MVLEKEKEEKFFIRLNQKKTTAYFKRNIKDLNTVVWQVIITRYFQVPLHVFSPTTQDLRPGYFLTLGVPEYLGHTEKPCPRKQICILKAKVIIPKIYRYNDYKFINKNLQSDNISIYQEFHI